MIDKILRKKVKIGERNVAYLTGGQGDPLVVIHGGGNGSLSWLKNAVELSKQYTIYVPDLPGFGKSQSISDSFKLKEYISFVDDFSHHLGLKQFHLIGHSLGGGIALHYALKFPQKISRFVLISSMFLGKEIALWVRFLSHTAFCKSFGEAGIAVLKAVVWLAKKFYAPFELLNPLTRVKMTIGYNITNLAGQTTVLLNELSGLMVPTLVVWGSRDNIVPVRQAYDAAQLIPDCQLHVFKGCGHGVHSQKLHDFSRLVTGFLGGKKHEIPD